MTTDNRPANCRFRLMDEGKTYPRSMCNACGKTIMNGLGKECTTLPAAPAPDDRPAAPAPDDRPAARQNLIERLKGINFDIMFADRDILANVNIETASATIQEAARELQQINAKLVIKGGDENYPTLWAYEQACAALDKHRNRADDLQADKTALTFQINAVENWKLPAPENRPEGFECLAFHRGKWRHVLWSKEHDGWSLGFAKAFIKEHGRKFAPLPQKPNNAGGFFDYKD